MPWAEILRRSGVEVLVLQGAVHSDLVASLEPGWALGQVFQSVQERDLDWAPKGHSRDDQNRGLTE